jgi:TonB family protein
MSAFIVPALAALLLLPPDSVKLMNAIPPLPPLNSPFAGVVVIDVTVDSGGNVQKASVVSGAPAFVQASLDAVQQWKFGAAPDGVEPRSVAITFLYRPPQLFSFGGMQLPESRIASTRPASPRLVYDAPYPVNSVAEGVVILELRISADGAIEQINTVRDIPPLTRAARTAVAAWKFSPAVRDGRPVEGTSIVAISFLRPVTN